MDFDLVISRGTIIDGSGKARYPADLGICNGEIAAIARTGTLSGGRSIDAAGLAVAPGFIDIHSHSDWVLPLPDHDKTLAPLVHQGVTTLVAGNCGHSPAPVTDGSARLTDASCETLKDQDFPFNWRSMGEFLDSLDRGGLVLNAAFLAGHGTLRQAAMGGDARAPTPSEMADLNALIRRSLREGAFGVSVGLAYAPGIFARNDELLSMARTVADEGGIFTAHGRAYVWISPFYKPMLGLPHNIRSTRELLDLGKKSGVRLQISHQIFIGRRTWPTYRWVLRDIDRAAADGVDVAFDAFPYTMGNTIVNGIMPEWVLDNFRVKIRDRRILDRLRREFSMFRLALGIDYNDFRLLWGSTSELAELEGLDFREIAARLGMSEFDAYVHVARESGGDARVLIGSYSGDGDREEPLRAVLSHPLCAFETDTILTQRGKHNPASFGTFPRVLGRYSRDLGLFTLEEAVRRMTSMPADRIGLKDVGRIVPGARADLVIFDPATVADNTTPRRTDAPPSGIRDVLIAGEVVSSGGALVGTERRGRVLRRS